jgi:hypothetical protein
MRQRHVVLIVCLLLLVNLIALAQHGGKHNIIVI